MQQKQKAGLVTATTLVAANMIGTGIFTSLGFQLAGIQNAFAILMLWVIGGIAALAGALSYGELGSMFPRSGGEYHFLGKIYHPLAGFLAGWVSFVVGFSAPIAAATMAAGEYSASVLKTLELITPAHQEIWMKSIATGLALGIALVHTQKIPVISRFQNVFTLLKITLIVVLIVFGFWLAEPQDISFLPNAQSLSAILSGSFAVSLVFVMYSYTGWNASAYIINEMDKPHKNLPLSLFLGTVIVILLYVPVNGVFLYAAPIEAMQGKEEVGYVAAEYIFGKTGGIIMGLLISIGLISAVSSMTWAGPRVIQVIGEDIRMFRFFARKNKNGVPALAIAIQTALVVFMILTSTFEAVIYYIGFTLTLSSFMAVLGVYVMRYRKPAMPRSYKTWGYPVTPAIFLLIAIWMMTYLAIDQPVSVLYSLLTLALGVVVYFINQWHRSRNSAH